MIKYTLLTRKTNALLLIFSTFLLFGRLDSLGAAVSDGTGWRAGDGERALASGIVVRFVDRGEDDAAALTMLRFMDRELGRLFRAPAIHGHAGCRIVISPLLPPEEIMTRQVGKNVELTISSRFPAEADAGLRNRLCSRMLAIRYGVNAGGRVLPAWLGAGMEHARRARRSSGKLVRNVFYYPLLRALLTEGNAPDWRAIVQGPAIGGGGVAQESYEELSRVVMEIFAEISSLSDNALGDYAVAMLAGEKKPDAIFSATLERRLRTVRQGYSADGAMRLLMERAAFNGNTPYPGEVAIGRLQAILQFEYSPPAGAGERAAKLRGVYLDLPRLFANGHREAELIRSRMVADLREWGWGAPHEALKPCEKLVGLLATINTIQTESQSIGMRQAAEELMTVLERQRKLDLALDAAETWTLSPYLNWQRELKESGRTPDVMTGKARDFMLRTEADYLDE